MRLPEALIDNDALANLTQIRSTGVLNLLRNLYSRIHIPIEVKNEYEKQVAREPERAIFLAKLRPDSGFWSLCTHFESLSLVALFNYKGIDKGEAELISQSEKIHVRLIISDDKKFKKAADSLHKNILIVSSLYLIAALDIHQLIPDYQGLIKALHPVRKFSSAQLRAAYELALQEYRVDWPKKKLSERTSLTKILE